MSESRESLTERLEAVLTMQAAVSPGWETGSVVGVLLADLLEYLTEEEGL